MRCLLTWGIRFGKCLRLFTFTWIRFENFMSPKHSTNNFVQHNLIEIFLYHKYTSRVWIHHNYYSADYWTFVSYPYGILWDIWDTFRKVLPNYPWTRHSSTLVRVSPKKKESNKNLPLDPCLTFFQNFVQMNALRMLKASKESVEQTIITLGYVLRLYDNIIANGWKEAIGISLDE